MRMRCIMVSLLVLVIYTLIYSLYFSLPNSFSGSDSDLFFINNISYDGSLSQFSKGKCTADEVFFTEEEFEKYWKYKDYGDCTLPGKDNIYIQDGIIKGECENSTLPMYFSDPGYSQKLGGMKIYPLWRDYVIDREKSEYFVVKCTRKRIYTFVVSKLNKTAAYRANKVRKELKGTEKPIFVLLLVLDSVSRFSAYKNLPKTVELLNEKVNFGEYSKNYSFYDFKTPSVLGMNTRPNMVPILYGQTDKQHDAILGKEDYLQLNQWKKFVDLQDKAIWMEYWKLGFVNMFIYDSVYDFMVKSFGRNLIADHVFNNFWRVAWEVYGYTDFSEKQRCAGNYDSHFYSLNYTEQFYRNYKHNNRFAYVHLGAGHENSGNIRTVDKDLVSFLKRTLDYFRDQDQDLAIFLLSDHGRQNSRLQFSHREYLNHRLPMTFYIQSKSIEKTLQNREILLHNTEHLVGRFDINLALKELSYYPYSGLTKAKSQKIKNNYPIKGSTNLLTEKISENRTCEDVGTKNLLCICREFEDVNMDKDEESLIVNAIIKLAKQTIKYYKSQRSDCQNLEKVALKTAQKFMLRTYSNGYDHLYRVVITSGSGAILNLNANFCKNSRIKKSKNVLSGPDHPYNTVFFNNTEYFVQLSEMKIQSKCDLDLCLC